MQLLGKLEDININWNEEVEREEHHLVADHQAFLYVIDVVPSQGPSMIGHEKSLNHLNLTHTSS